MEISTLITSLIAGLSFIVNLIFAVCWGIMKEKLKQEHAKRLTFEGLANKERINFYKKAMNNYIKLYKQGAEQKVGAVVKIEREMMEDFLLYASDKVLMQKRKAKDPDIKGIQPMLNHMDLILLMRAEFNPTTKIDRDYLAHMALTPEDYEKHKELFK
jgi:hypothetical protein